MKLASRFNGIEHALKPIHRRIALDIVHHKAGLGFGLGGKVV